MHNATWNREVIFYEMPSRTKNITGKCYNKFTLITKPFQNLMQFKTKITSSSLFYNHRQMFIECLPSTEQKQALPAQSVASPKVLVLHLQGTLSGWKRESNFQLTDDPITFITSCPLWNHRILIIPWAFIKYTLFFLLGTR